MCWNLSTHEYWPFYFIAKFYEWEEINKKKSTDAALKKQMQRNYDTNQNLINRNKL